ncbi:hypothetical protein KFL_001440200 [Klebsormidium nitens]|uniref:Uncharacterized protein n=1 Tax=Klebsormidium nitens TaxID=105231 RepID=A0A1Y1I030_KLENI|nr:hypothetical protein KFL_001440200 [Klebsormidium nitens]|eukprot:GAQ83332.1 hypothetical protein KFL_001440200 [Klebsormidium nitens]
MEKDWEEEQEPAADTGRCNGDISESPSASDVDSGSAVYALVAESERLWRLARRPPTRSHFQGFRNQSEETQTGRVEGKLGSEAGLQEQLSADGLRTLDSGEDVAANEKEGPGVKRRESVERMKQDGGCHIQVPETFIEDPQLFDRVISKLSTLSFRNGCDQLPLRTPLEERMALSDAKDAWNGVLQNVGHMVALGCPSAFKALFQELTDTWPALGVSTSWTAVMPEAAIDMYQQGDFMFEYEYSKDGVEFVADTVYDVVKRCCELCELMPCHEGLRLIKLGQLRQDDYLLRQFGPELAVLITDIQPRITRDMCGAHNFDSSEALRDNIAKLRQCIAQGRLHELVQELRGERLADDSFELRHWD